MVNEIKLQEGHPIDENLRPLKIGGELSGIELSREDARIRGDLYINGEIKKETIYSGTILGYTAIGLDETPAKHDVLASMTVLDDDMKVSFVFPPSGKVEIMASIYVQTDGTRPLTFGLSTTNATTGFTTLGALYENHTFQSDETDGYQHTHRWYVTGIAGNTKELWFAAGCTHTGRYDLYWGGDSSSVAQALHPMEYQPFIMKATALPATTNTG